MTFVLRLKTQPCILILSCTSVTNVGSTKTRRKVTSENGCRQASMSKSYFNDIFPYSSQPGSILSWGSIPLPQLAAGYFYTDLTLKPNVVCRNLSFFSPPAEEYMQHISWNSSEQNRIPDQIPKWPTHGTPSTRSHRLGEVSDGAWVMCLFSVMN